MGFQIQDMGVRFLIRIVKAGFYIQPYSLFHNKGIAEGVIWLATAGKSRYLLLKGEGARDPDRLKNRSGFFIALHMHSFYTFVFFRTSTIIITYRSYNLWRPLSRYFTCLLL